MSASNSTPAPREVIMTLGNFCPSCVKIIESKPPLDLIGPMLMELQCTECSREVRKAINGNPDILKIPGYCGNPKHGDFCYDCSRLSQKEGSIYLDVLLPQRITSLQCGSGCSALAFEIVTFNNLADAWEDLCGECQVKYLPVTQSAPSSSISPLSARETWLGKLCPYCVSAVLVQSIHRPINVILSKIDCDKCRNTIKTLLTSDKPIQMSSKYLCNSCKNCHKDQVVRMGDLCDKCCGECLERNDCTKLSLNLPIRSCTNLICDGRKFKNFHDYQLRFKNYPRLCKDCENFYPVALPVFPETPPIPSSSNTIASTPALSSVKTLSFCGHESKKDAQSFTCTGCREITLESIYVVNKTGNRRLQKLCLYCFAKVYDCVDITTFPRCYHCYKTTKENKNKLFCKECAGPKNIREEYYRNLDHYVLAFEHDDVKSKDMQWLMSNCNNSPLFYAHDYRELCRKNPELLFIQAADDSKASHWIRIFSRYFEHFFHQYMPKMPANLAGPGGRIVKNKTMEQLMRSVPHYLLRLYQEDTFPSDISRRWVQFNIEKIRYWASFTPKPTKKVVALKPKPLLKVIKAKPVKEPKPAKVKPEKAPKPPRVKKDPDAKYADPARMEVGKYKGRKMAFVAEKHSVYLLRQHRLDRLTPMENEWVENNKDEIISTLNFPGHTINHHKTPKTMEQILEEDPSYMIFVAEKMSYNTKARKWVEANWNLVLQALEESGVDLEAIEMHKL